MLILTRKKEESILIGDSIKITVVEVQKNQVKIGIEAPKDLTVLREELVREVQKENQRAVKIDLEILRELPQFLAEKNTKNEENEG